MSTQDQTCETQLAELRQWAKNYQWDVVDEYIDSGWSGTKQDRPELSRLMADARHRKFDSVLVCKLDRFGRSMQHCVATIQQLTDYGVRFLCTSQGIDTDQSNPTSKLLLHLLAAFAEFEHGIIKERVRSGIERARKQGTHLGRPKRVLDTIRLAELRRQGLTYRQIGQELEVGAATILRHLRNARV